MGKKHKRGSQSSHAGLQRDASNTSSNNLSPKTPATRHSAGSGSFLSDPGFGEPSPEKELRKDINNLRITETSGGVQLPGLPFKTFKNETLITPNGEPTVLPATSPTEAASAISRLSAASLSFVPVTPSPKPITKPIYHAEPAGLPTPPTPGYEKIQNLLQDIRGSPSHGYGGHAARCHGGYFPGNNGGYSGHSRSQGGHAQQSHCHAQLAGNNGRYPTPPGHIGGLSRTHTPSPGPSPVHSYDSVPRGPRNPVMLAAQPARHVQTLGRRPLGEFLARKDRGKKDILVTADGITRNHVRITERQLPNGIPYQSFHDDFDSSKYNFVEEFRAMTADEKEGFLTKNSIDILVQMKAPEERTGLATTEPGAKIEELKGKKGKSKNRNRSRITDVEDSNESMEFKVLNVANEASDVPGKPFASVASKSEVSSLDVLKTLGPEVSFYAKRLTVTLAFPPSKNPANLAPMLGAGPVAQFTITPPAGPAQNSSNFILLKTLVDYIHTFKSLHNLSIILRVPATQRMPFTMRQLYHVLPFYDLGFTDWDIKYLPDNLSVPAKVQGWAVGQLDRERNKIIAERLRKVEEAVFVRGSVMPGISNENLNAAAACFNNTVASISTSSGARRSRGSRSSRASQ
ncbi:hypothetical protein ONS96_009992 [Cadophora gregata f. sp. sojae]|nr:hypothetical protein ONS96_009992 [Cadophora gregata f. sp. sojae]